MPGMLSDGTTVLQSHLSVGGTDANGNVFGQLWVGSNLSAPTFTFSNLTVASGVSTASLTGSNVTVQTKLFLGPAKLSWTTAANSSGRTIGELTLVFAASGISLMYSSGKSEYIIAGSATSGAQG